MTDHCDEAENVRDDCDHDGDPRLFRNFYRCYRCDHEWDDIYSSQPDDDCPACGAPHCSPHESEDA